jgi:RNA polymerase sigma factor (sigma-70 family)
MKKRNESPAGADSDTRKSADPEVTRRTLLEKVRNPADSKAWSDFYTRYNTLIRGYATSHCFVKHLPLTQDDIEDVVQDVMIKLSQKMGDFVYKPGEHAFRSFLATVTRRRCIDKARKINCRPDWNAENPMQEVAGDDGAERTDPIDRLPDDRTGDLTKDIERHDMTIGRDLALEKLRASPNVTLNQYAVFEKIVMGVPLAEICAQLDKTLNTVYTIRNRVKRYYEKALNEAKAELDEPLKLPPPLQASSGLPDRRKTR